MLTGAVIKSLKLNDKLCKISGRGGMYVVVNPWAEVDFENAVWSIPKERMNEVRLIQMLGKI